MSDISFAAAYMRVAPVIVTAELPEPLTELADWAPVVVDTPWQVLLNEQLATVLKEWLRGKSFSRRNRRDYQKLNLGVRTGEVELAPLSPL